MDNVIFMNEDIADREMTALALEEAAKKYRNGDIKLALCTFVNETGDPSYIIGGQLNQPQECLLTMGMLDYQHSMVSNLMHRLMSKSSNEHEETDSAG
jgi:hypothetical protein